VLVRRGDDGLRADADVRHTCQPEMSHKCRSHLSIRYILIKSVKPETLRLKTTAVGEGHLGVELDTVLTVVGHERRLRPPFLAGEARPAEAGGGDKHDRRRLG